MFYVSIDRTHAFYTNIKLKLFTVGFFRQNLYHSENRVESKREYRLSKMINLLLALGSKMTIRQRK